MLNTSSQLHAKSVFNKYVIINRWISINTWAPAEIFVRVGKGTKKGPSQAHTKKKGPPHGEKALTRIEKAPHMEKKKHYGEKKPPTSGAPNSAKFRGGCRGPSKIRQRGGCNNFLFFTP